MNIVENRFAEENRDWFSINMNVDRNKYNPKPTQDYYLTASFAKKLCMTSNSPRGEQARDYFIKVENALRDVALKQQSKPVPTLNKIKKF